MKAIVIGEAGKLIFERVPDPRPGAGEVLLEIQAAAVNRRDLIVRIGPYNFPPRSFLDRMAPASGAIRARRWSSCPP